MLSIDVILLRRKSSQDTELFSQGVSSNFLIRRARTRWRTSVRVGEQQSRVAHSARQNLEKKNTPQMMSTASLTRENPAKMSQVCTSVY